MFMFYSAAVAIVTCVGFVAIRMVLNTVLRGAATSQNHRYPRRLEGTM